VKGNNLTAHTQRFQELILLCTRMVPDEEDRVERFIGGYQTTFKGMKMPNTRSGASMTHEEVEELVARRVAEEMEAREAARNLETMNENEDEQEGENGGNGNRGNEENKNGNRNGNHGMNYRSFMPMARECTFQDFLKCKPHNFSVTEGVVGLTRWCPPKYQVKYATCTLQDSALTCWNSHKRTIGVEAAYAMKWARLMKLMTEELILLCTRMVPDEEDRVERFIGGYQTTGFKVPRGFTSLHLFSYSACNQFFNLLMSHGCSRSCVRHLPIT
nr:hypothetical protein [Tanacetum cinerariifolium]